MGRGHGVFRTAPSGPGSVVNSVRKPDGTLAAADVDRFAGLLIDKLLAQPVAGLAVDPAERNPLRG